MIKPTDQFWVDYIKFVLEKEGFRTDDTHDRAFSCIANLPYSQTKNVHTVWGVTWCDFKARAAGLGIPMEYSRFYNLTQAEAAMFLYDHYKDIQGPLFNHDGQAMILVETAWGHGVVGMWDLVIKYLQKKHNKHDWDNVPKAWNKKKTSYYYNPTKAQQRDIIAYINKLPAKQTYLDFQKMYYDYLDWLSQPGKYNNKYRAGWLNREKRFQKLFPPELFEKKKTGGWIDNIVNFFISDVRGKEIIKQTTNIKQYNRSDNLNVDTPRLHEWELRYKKKKGKL